jgi:hypothetical protein
MSPLVGLHLQGIRLRKLGPMRLNGCENESGPRRSRSGRPHRRYGSCSHRWLRWRCCCRRPQTRSCHCRRRWTDQAMIRPPPAGAATDPRRPGTRPRCSTRTLSTIESNDGSASRPLGSAVRSLCILVRKASSSASARAASRTAPRLRRTGSSASRRSARLPRVRLGRRTRPPPTRARRSQGPG